MSARSSFVRGRLKAVRQKSTASITRRIASNATPVESRPEYPEQTKASQIGPEEVFEGALAVGILWLLFRYGVSVEGAIGGLIGACCGYSWDRKQHRARVNHARIYDGWENPETYPKDYGGMFAYIFMGVIAGMGIVGLLN